MSQACLLSDVHIAATTPDHLDRMPADLPNHFIDGWRENGRSRVALAGGDIVATGLSWPNRAHPTRDLLRITVREPWRRQGIGTWLYRELRVFHRAPFSAKAAPGSVAHAFVTSLGGQPYQSCPGGRVDASDSRVQEWARVQYEVFRASGGRVRRGDELEIDQLRELVADQYEVVHASWSPSDRDGIMDSVVTDLAEDDLGRYRWTERGGRATALAVVYREDGDLWSHIEALEPSASGAREDVAACFAAVLDDVAHADDQGDGRVLFFDQHRTDPHAYPLLMSIPGVGGQAIELLEIPRG